MVEFEHMPQQNGNGNGQATDYQTDALYVHKQGFVPTSRLGSAQRSEQMDRTIAQVEALTERVNQQTQAINNLFHVLKTEMDERESDGQLSAHRLLMFTHMSLWQRLRWLVGL